MTASRVSRDKNPVRTPTMLCNIGMGPRKCACYILDMRRMRNRRAEAVADHNDPDALACEHLPHIPVHLAVTRAPRPAMDEENDWEIF